MKQSPRAWLLSRHQAATPSLDSARHPALAAALRDNAPVPTSQLLSALFLPHRRLWTTLAASWALLLALHLSQRPPAAASPATTNTELAARTDSFLNRQAQLHALLR